MPHRAIADFTTAAAAGTAPWWLTLVNYGYQSVMAVGALALLILRIAIAWREWRATRERYSTDE
ncbi:hypothetical protein [Azospirillum sp. sgz302134]